jgi:hypothetical protein
MPATKLTMIFDLATNLTNTAIGHRVGGWTESVYFQGPDVQARETLRQLCVARAPLLPTGARISGQRYQQVDPPGASSTGALEFPGSSGTQADIPQMCLHCRIAGAGVSNHRNLDIRGIPDARVIEGEYFPSSGFTAALNAYVTALGFTKFRALDRAQQPFRLLSVLTTGVFNTELAHGWANDNLIYVSRVKPVLGGDTISGLFRISDVTTFGGKFVGWPDTVAGTGGFGKRRLIIYPTFDPTSFGISRIITRKVGRPPGQYRGRASARR